jgi:DUF3040 family protein
VEVVSVLEPNEKVLFDGLVTRLRADDPGFTEKLDRMCRPRQRLRVALAVLLWTIAPICIVFGGWTGVLMAAVAAGFGAHLMTRRSAGGGLRLTPPRRLTS